MSTLLVSMQLTDLCTFLLSLKGSLVEQVGLDLMQLLFTLPPIWLKTIWGKWYQTTGRAWVGKVRALVIWGHSTFGCHWAGLWCILPAPARCSSSIQLTSGVWGLLWSDSTGSSSPPFSGLWLSSAKGLIPLTAGGFPSPVSCSAWEWSSSCCLSCRWCDQRCSV